MTELELTEEQYCLCINAIIKCKLLSDIVKHDLPCNLTSKNFRFPEITSDEESELVIKLHQLSQIAFLRSQRQHDKSSD